MNTRVKIRCYKRTETGVLWRAFECFSEISKADKKAKKLLEEGFDKVEYESITKFGYMVYTKEDPNGWFDPEDGFYL